MTKVSKLYCNFIDLAEICNDDLSLLVEILHFHHKDEEKLSRIKSDLEEWRDIERLERYATTIDNILSLPATYIRVWISVKRGKIKGEIVKLDRNKPIKQNGREVHSLFEGTE